MNAKKFSDAMSELDTKYVDEALNYKKKSKKPGWVKWGAMAACFAVIAVLGVGVFRIKFTHSVGKLFCVHTNTSLSIKYCFIFSRIRVSRTEMFFSESPINSAMSL